MSNREISLDQDSELLSIEYSIMCSVCKRHFKTQTKELRCCSQHCEDNTSNVLGKK